MSEITKELEICKLHAQLQEKTLDLSRSNFAMNQLREELKFEKKETKFFIGFSIVTWGILIPILCYLINSK